MPAQTQSADLKLYREYDAPLSAVWDAWSRPDEIKEWWGPRGFTITTHSREFKTGGTWKYTMHGPDKVDYENFTKYLEVDNGKKLVYDHGGTETSNALFRVTVLFSEENGKTKFDMTMTFPSPQAAATSTRFIKKAGGEATWDRLAEFLEKKVHAKEIFEINRSFDTSIDEMFNMWTAPEHMAKWVAPAGFTVKYNHIDVKNGGKAFYSMSNGKEMTMYGRCQYIEINRPDRIAYTQQFCDENENITHHPMSPTWPQSMLTTVTLTAEGPDRTRVTLTWEEDGEWSAEEMETFINARAGMTAGWTGSLDKLEEYLEQQP
ncbi:MAG: SRPBCC domain-containing protein [Candidatus Obscuribacterales bacterium]|nr:SRPBCC domain-containing protein [Candidatus Obscuribacterales bacterium]